MSWPPHNNKAIIIKIVCKNPWRTHHQKSAFFNQQSAIFAQSAVAASADRHTSVGKDLYWSLTLIFLTFSIRASRLATPWGHAGKNAGRRLLAYCAPEHMVLRMHRYTLTHAQVRRPARRKRWKMRRGNARISWCLQQFLAPLVIISLSTGEWKLTDCSVLWSLLDYSLVGEFPFNYDFGISRLSPTD